MLLICSYLHSDHPLISIRSIFVIISDDQYQPWKSGNTSGGRQGGGPTTSNAGAAEASQEEGDDEAMGPEVTETENLLGNVSGRKSTKRGASSAKGGPAKK